MRFIISIAVRSIKENLTRSALSAVGIMVGTLAVMLLISIAQGVREDVRTQVDSLGGNIVIVVPGVIDTSSPFGNSGNIGLSPFTERDEQSVSRAKGVLNTAKWTFVGGTVTTGDSPPGQAFTLAVDLSWFDIRKHEFSEGGGFTSPIAREAVIGEMAKESLFGEQSAVGEVVKINGVEFVIVGVTRESGSAGVLGGNPFARILYVPFQSAADSLAGGKKQIDRIFAQTDPNLKPGEVKSSIEAAVLESQGGERTFSVLTQDDLLEAIYKVLNILTYLVVGISAIALFVGGVGIMTVMLMNVNERRREIGIRKTVGARRSDIFSQFLLESVALTTAGGALGLIATWLSILIIEASTPIRASLTLPVIALGFGLSIGVGCIFGMIPAMRAAAKDPVDAMRFE